MKTWIICEYGYWHVIDPITCHPVAKVTISEEDEDKLDEYCRKHDVCAFGEEYYKHHDRQFFDSLPTADIYQGRGRKAK